MLSGKPLPISVCLIAGDEVHRIARALASVQGWTAEIVVVINDLVTDGTDRVAVAHGARIFSQPWQGYAAQRNFATRQATQPWILAIDADEVVSDGLREEIIALFAAGNGTASPAAYSFPRLSYFCGRWIRHGNWYPDRKARLWQKGCAEWQGIVHERLVVAGTTCSLKSDLLHFSNGNIDQLLGKISLFSTLFVRETQASGKEVGWLDLAFRPVWKFLRAYFIRRGFMDGWQGYFIAWTEAYSTVTRYAKVIEAGRKNFENRPDRDSTLH